MPSYYVLVEDGPATTETTKVFGAAVTMKPVVDASGVSFARLCDANGHHFVVYSMPSVTD